MPTTSSGTAYTVTTIDLGSPHGVMHYAVGDAVAASADIPTVLYAHGAGGASNQFATLSSWSLLRDWLIDNGCAWVEGEGGAGTGAQNWGNLAARAAYPAYLTRARLSFDVGPVVLLGRSMGGLVTSWLYAHATDYVGWINNSGVSTYLTGNTSGAKDTAAATGWYFSPTCWTAWGQSTMGAFTSTITAADAVPEAWAASLWDGKNILCCYGDADTTVPWAVRGAKPLRTLWEGRPAQDVVSLTPGGGHGGAVTSYTDMAAMIPFLTDRFGLTPEPVEPLTQLTVTFLGVLDANGKAHKLTFA